ncbi:hypothetical protein NH44784_050941 [Achromobacter xylosoxidans NH44784-1996]|nr:hypothetical protein NH44784_050941 [Achromobacter xylosoxidans NH44784-1996]
MPPPRRIVAVRPPVGARDGACRSRADVLKSRHGLIPSRRRRPPRRA